MLITQKLINRLRKIKDSEYEVVYELFQNYTMIPRSIYIGNLKLALSVASIPGAIVECGTWKGGMIAGIAKLLGKNRDYYLFDSFEGLPPVEPIDGQAARQWQENTEGFDYHNNCTASEVDAATAMSLAGIKDAKLVKGWFESTLPLATFPNGIAILRMDADWYTSTLQILNSLFPLVNKGGIIIIDDYYTWDGCSIAVHEFFCANKKTAKIHEQNGICYIKI